MKIRLSTPSSLRARLVGVVLAAIIPLAGAAAVKAWFDSRDAIARVTGELEAATAFMATQQVGTALSVWHMLTAIAENPGLLASPDANCQRYFSALSAGVPAFANIGVIGPDGVARCHGRGSDSVFVGDRDYFKRAVGSQEFTVGGYMIGRFTGQPAVNFALPVNGEDGAPAGVVFASLKLGELAEGVVKTPLPAGSTLVVADRNGVVLATRPAGSAEIGKPLPGGLLQQALASRRDGVMEGRDAGGVERIVSFSSTGAPVERGFFIAVSAERDRVLAPGHLQLALQLGALALMAALGAALAWLIGGRAIVRPAQDIVNVTRAIQQGQIDRRMVETMPGASTELMKIAEGFNQMASALQLREQALQCELTRSRLTQRKLVDAQKLGRMGNWETDLPGTYLWCSEEVEAMFGMSPGEFDGRVATMVAMICPNDRERFLLERDNAVRDGTDLDIEYAIVTPDGTPRCLHQLGRLQRDASGHAVCYAGVIQDITARRESARALAESNELLTRTGEMARVGGWTVELEGMQLRGTEQLHRIYELPDGAALGFDEAIAAFPEASRAQLEALVRRAYKRGAPWDVELPMTTRCGSAIWVQMRGKVVREHGKIVRLIGALQDITARKLANQAAVEAEQRYQALFADAPVPMWVYDTENFTFLTVNRAAEQAYGYTREEFLRRTLFDIRPHAEREALRQHLTGTPGTHRDSWIHCRKDGSVFHVNVLSQPVHYADRQARFAVILDLTAQREAEAVVQEHLFTMQRAADAAQAITWHRSLDAMMQEVADQARGVIGTHQALVTLTSSDDLTQPVHSLSASETHRAIWAGVDLPELCGLFKPVLAHNRPVRMSADDIDAFRRRGVRPNPAADASPDGQSGCVVPAMGACLAVPLMGRSGNNIGLLQMSDKYQGQFTLQDEYIALELARLVSVAMENARLFGELNQMTVNLEQKVRQRTAALTRQESLFRALAEQAPQIVWTVDTRGRATYFNRAWFDLMGGTMEDWHGFQWFSVIHPEDLPDVKDNWARATAERVPYGGIRRMVTRDGSVHTMSYSSSPVCDEQGEIAFWVGIDANITEIMATEAALRLSNQELESFSYSVSHDLRSPLNTIDGFSQLLSRQLDQGASEKARHYLSRIHAGVAQMSQLIDDMLSLAHVSQAPLRRGAVDVSLLAQQVVENLRASAPDRPVEVLVEPGLQADGDARLLRIAIENLIGNAWKFSSRRADARIVIGQSRELAPQQPFFVRDNGAGFDMAYSDKLFRAFQRLHTVDEFPGTGIGLATVNRIIGRHGGSLWAESSPGNGATFFFTLPTLPASR